MLLPLLSEKSHCEWNLFLPVELALLPYRPQRWDTILLVHQNLRQREVLFDGVFLLDDCIGFCGAAGEAMYAPHS